MSGEVNPRRSYHSTTRQEQGAPHPLHDHRDSPPPVRDRRVRRHGVALQTVYKVFTNSASDECGSTPTTKASAAT